MDAWRNMVVSPRSFKYKLVDACEMPFADANFDLVIANHMLYAVSDTAKAIREIHRILKPGGTLLAATNGTRHMLELAPYVSMLDPNASQDPENIFYKQLAFTLENAAEQLEPVFSSVARLEYEDSLEIDEVEPVLEYLLSGFELDKIKIGSLAAVKAALLLELKNKSILKVNKNSGCFICS